MSEILHWTFVGYAVRTLSGFVLFSTVLVSTLFLFPPTSIWQSQSVSLLLLTNGAAICIPLIKQVLNMAKSNAGLVPANMLLPGFFTAPLHLNFSLLRNAGYRFEENGELAIWDTHRFSELITQKWMGFSWRILNSIWIVHGHIGNWMIWWTVFFINRGILFTNGRNGHAVLTNVLSSIIQLFNWKEKNLGLVTDSKSWPPQYCCDTLPTDHIHNRCHDGGRINLDEANKLKSEI